MTILWLAMDSFLIWSSLRSHEKDAKLEILWHPDGIPGWIQDSCPHSCGCWGERRSSWRQWTCAEEQMWPNLSYVKTNVAHNAADSTVSDRCGLTGSNKKPSIDTSTVESQCCMYCWMYAQQLFLFHTSWPFMWFWCLFLPTATLANSD